MRIIAGIYRGQKLCTAKGDWLRPTTDRVKTYIFDKLGVIIRDAAVLDLFAGSGALGIEALSRGAKSVLFVDKSPAAVKIIAQNLKALQNQSMTVVLHAEALHFLEKMAGGKNKFDIIFADPPYDFHEQVRLMQGIARGTVLKEGGMLVLEQRSSKEVRKEYATLIVVGEKKFGNTSIVWLKKSGDAR